MENTAYYREMIDRLRTDANEQVQLYHVCASTKNALEAAAVLEQLTAELEHRENLIRQNKNGTLKPCPLCGARAERTVTEHKLNISWRDYKVYTVRVQCVNCGCEIHLDYHPPTWVKRPASEAGRQGALRWNRRI